MAEFEITHFGVGQPKNATKTPYGRLHVPDFIDVWPTKGPAFGVDHLIYEDGEVEHRVMGRLLSELPGGEAAK